MAGTERGYEAERARRDNTWLLVSQFCVFVPSLNLGISGITGPGIDPPRAVGLLLALAALAVFLCGLRQRRALSRVPRDAD